MILSFDINIQSNHLKENPLNFIPRYIVQIVSNLAKNCG